MELQAESTNSQHSDPIVLVCTADDNYAMPLAVTLRSVLYNLDTSRKLSIYVIDGGIKDVNKQKIVSSLQSENVHLTWLQPLHSLISDLEVSWYYTKTVYYRLFITELLPQHYEKVIYLDADVVVVEDLSKLWDVDIQNYYIAAVQDQYPIKDEYLLATKELKNLPRPQGLQSTQKDPGTVLQDFDDSTLPLKSDINPQAFFNAGILVINLEKWRKEAVGTEILNFIGKNKQYSLNDQDGLNIFFRGIWKKLDSRWNQTAGIYEYKPFVKSVLEGDELKLLESNPYIIHFTSAAKPWNSINGHPAQPLFYKYLDMTAWSGWRFTQRKRFIRRLNREIDALKGVFTQSAFFKQVSSKRLRK